MNELPGNDSSHVYNRAFLLHGPKRNAVLRLAEIQQYGLDSFADADYISIYGMAPHEWYRHGVRLLGRTAVECTRDALGDRIGLDVASVATRMSASRLLVLDLFTGSCNTLFWILRHLPNSDGIAFESDPQVFELTHRNLSALNQKIELVYGDFASLLEELRVQEDRGIIAFVAPPWGAALDEVKGLDLGRTKPPVIEVIDQIAHRFANHKMLFATQVHENVSAPSLDQIRTHLDWTALRIYDINERGRNHGVVLGTKGWIPW